MKRIGVFLCWCGTNIGGVVDIPKVAEVIKAFPGVVFVQDNKYSCSESGQNTIVQAIKEHKIEAAVVSACSPRMHLPTFQKAAEKAGINQFMVEMANVREHCSWVHSNEPEKATQKAIELVRKAVAKVSKLEPLFESYIPVTKRALVIGGGIAGLQTALDIADAGHQVVIVEKEPTIGGRMAQLDKTFPTLDCGS
jgi:heterodisulfide reductase subunit A